MIIEINTFLTLSSKDHSGHYLFERNSRWESYKHDSWVVSFLLGIRYRCLGIHAFLEYGMKDEIH